MSGRTEIVYKPDPDMDIEEFKVEPLDISEEAGKDADQESQGTSDNVMKRLKVASSLVVSCDQCEYSGSKKQFRIHMKKHEGIRYPCDQCEYTTTDLSVLKRHKKSKHEGFRYSCDQCEYTGTRKQFRLHKRKHEGFIYRCDQCEYAATDQSTLKRHKESKHEGIRYALDDLSNLSKPKESKTKHSDISVAFKFVRKSTLSKVLYILQMEFISHIYDVHTYVCIYFI